MSDTRTQGKRYAIPLTVAALAMIGSTMGGCAAATDTPAKSASSSATKAAPSKAAPKTVKKTKPAKPQMSVAQKNAVRSAKNYLSISGFSRTGLIKQLKFEGHSKKDATKAVDSMSVDYNKQAARAGKAYLDISGFSRSGLITQLKFDGYTTSQATYAAKKLGL